MQCSLLPHARYASTGMTWHAPFDLRREEAWRRVRVAARAVPNALRISLFTFPSLQLSKTHPSTLRIPHGLQNDTHTRRPTRIPQQPPKPICTNTCTMHARVHMYALLCYMLCAHASPAPQCTPVSRAFRLTSPPPAPHTPHAQARHGAQKARRRDASRACRIRPAAKPRACKKATRRRRDARVSPLRVARLDVTGDEKRRGILPAYVHPRVLHTRSSWRRHIRMLQLSKDTHTRRLLREVETQISRGGLHALAARETSGELRGYDGRAEISARYRESLRGYIRAVERASTETGRALGVCAVWAGWERGRRGVCVPYCLLLAKSFLERMSGLSIASSLVALVRSDIVFSTASSLWR